MRSVTVGIKYFPILLCLLLMSSVVLADNSDFILECPHSVTISCMDDTRDLSIYGKAHIWEHHVKRDAGPATMIVRDQDDCGVGTIERIWEIEDGNSKIHRCTQIITITDNGLLFSETDITWPKPFDTSGCTVNLDPRNLEDPYDIPRFKRVGCSKPIYNYKDDVLTFSSTCRKVLRRWRVIDCCQYDPRQPGTGEWIHFQIIKVVVKDTPDIKCPKLIELSAQSCDGAEVQMDTIFAKDKCGKVLKVTNNSKYANDKGANAQGMYPIGTTEFYYMVEYACGKVYRCKVKVIVKNDLKPSPYCRNGLIVTLMGMDTDNDGINDEGMVEVWAKDLDIGSFHKCGKRMLHLSFSSDTSDKSIIFTCDSLGKNVVELWVTDEFGNQSFCRTYIVVQNNGSNIPDCERDSITGTIFNIAGNVKAINGAVNDDVIMALRSPSMYMDVKVVTDSVFTTHRDTFIGKTGTVYVRVTRDTQVVNICDTTYSDMFVISDLDSSGEYEFIDLPRNFEYELKPSSVDKSMNGIDMRDAYALFMHLIGWRPLKSPYQYLAADINNDGSINNFDYQILSKAVIDRKFPSSIVNYWSFIDQSLNVDINNVFTISRSNSIDIGNLDSHQMKNNFVGIKKGDLNFDFSNTVTNDNLNLRENDIMDLELSNQYLTSNNEYLIPIFKNNAAYVAGQLSISFDLSRIQIMDIKNGTAICNYNVFQSNHKSLPLLKFNWVDPNVHPSNSPIAYFRIKAIANCDLNSVFNFDNQFKLENISFTDEGNLAVTRLVYRSEKEIENSVEGLHEYKFVPNPFYESTNLQLHVDNPGNSSYNLEIVNAIGNTILLRTGTFDGVDFSLDLDLGNTTDNVLFYRLNFGGNTYSGKLIHLTN